MITLLELYGNTFSLFYQWVIELILSLCKVYILGTHKEETISQKLIIWRERKWINLLCYYVTFSINLSVLNWVTFSVYTSFWTDSSHYLYATAVQMKGLCTCCLVLLTYYNFKRGHWLEGGKSIMNAVLNLHTLATEYLETIWHFSIN